VNIKKGNAVNLQTLVKDSNNVILTNLSSTTEIIFVLKKNKTDLDSESLIIKKKSLSEISIDYPSIGYLSIALNSDDTNIDIDTYYFAIQLQYTPETKIELNLLDNNGIQSDRIKISQDIIHG
jgi:hypothetical protein